MFYRGLSAYTHVKKKWKTNFKWEKVHVSISSNTCWWDFNFILWRHNILYSWVCGCKFGFYHQLYMTSDHCSVSKWCLVTIVDWVSYDDTFVSHYFLATDIFKGHHCHLLKIKLDIFSVKERENFLEIPNRI